MKTLIIITAILGISTTGCATTLAVRPQGQLSKKPLPPQGTVVVAASSHNSQGIARQAVAPQPQAKKKKPRRRNQLAVAQASQASQGPRHSGQVSARPTEAMPAPQQTVVLTNDTLTPLELKKKKQAAMAAGHPLNPVTWFEKIKAKFFSQTE